LRDTVRGSLVLLMWM